MASTALQVDPDRLLSAEPSVRAIARRPYEHVRELPLIAPHGHVDPALLLDDRPFPDPATLLITPDHSVTRLLHADVVEPAPLGVGQGTLTEEASRRALVLAAWICCLRGLGAPVSDVRAQVVVPLAAGPRQDAVPGVLRGLGPALADDADLIVTVLQQCEQLEMEAKS
jgi:hypothetical protein